VVSTLRVVTNTNPVHALLYLIISLMAVAMTCFQPRRTVRRCAGSDRLRWRHHGAVRVCGDDAQPRAGLGRAGTRQWLKPGIWIGPAMVLGASAAG
jgi:NADH-quinone oxidoreductase subunit J